MTEDLGCKRSTRVFTGNALGDYCIEGEKNGTKD